jgi:hypothetical protein
MDNDPEAAANRERQRRHREKLKEESEALHNVTSRDPVAAAAGGVVTTGIKEGVQGEKPPAPPAKPAVEIPDILQSQDGFMAAWEAWLVHRKAKKNPATDRVKAVALRRLSERPTEAVEGLDTCIVAGWIDIRWDWIDNRNKQDVKLPIDEHPVRWLGGEKMWAIPGPVMDDLERRYAGIDIELELVKLNDWLHKKPDVQKTKSFRVLIENWLERAKTGGR